MTASRIAFRHRHRQDLARLLPVADNGRSERRNEAMIYSAKIAFRPLVNSQRVLGVATLIKANMAKTSMAFASPPTKEENIEKGLLVLLPSATVPGLSGITSIEILSPTLSRRRISWCVFLPSTSMV